MTRNFRLPIAILALLPACDAPSSNPIAPALPQFGIATEHTIHLEEQGETVDAYLASNPAQQQVVLDSCGPTALQYVVQVGYGTAAHLGYTTVVNEMCVYPVTPASTTWTSHIRIIAANRDEISGGMNGTATIINPQGDYLWSAEPIHFTEGTGRFASVILDGVWQGGGNVFARTVWGVLDGTLRYAARDAARR